MLWREYVFDLNLRLLNYPLFINLMFDLNRVDLVVSVRYVNFTLILYKLHTLLILKVLFSLR